jgi:hypothetical protein
MGTSQSSGGSPSGVPMVPPWVPDIEQPINPEEAPKPADGNDDVAPPNSEAPDVPSAAITIAPRARFSGARRNLRTFASTGDAGSMRRGLGQYVKTGYGGAGTAVRRFGGTAKTAGALYGALSALASGQAPAPGSQLDPALLAKKSAQDVMDAVLEAVRPVDGTQDAEAGRTAIQNALSELLTRFPDADLVNLDEEQRLFAIECYVSLDVFFRFDLDLGKSIRDKAPNAMVGLSRLKEVKDYIKEVVSDAFRKLKNVGQTLSGTRVVEIVRDALRETFGVFEGYSQ